MCRVALKEPRALKTCRKPKSCGGRSRHRRRRLCPRCGRSCYRHRTMQRRLHDLGDLVSERPREIHITYSQHYCCRCRRYFNADMLDLAPPKSHYTHRVIALAVRLVVEDGLPYRAANAPADYPRAGRIANAPKHHRSSLSAL